MKKGGDYTWQKAAKVKALGLGEKAVAVEAKNPAALQVEVNADRSGHKEGRRDVHSDSLLPSIEGS